MVLVPCPNLQRNATYAELPRTEAISKYRSEQFPDDEIDRVRAAVLHRLSVIPSLSDVQACILHEVVDTPATYAEKCNVAAGTPFGLSHGLQQLNLFRPPSRVFSSSPKQEPSNVVYCGASTRPGNGVPLVLTGAKLVAEKVLQTLKARRHSGRPPPY
jgi:phytoene desaturase (3,4-didehydrolycopene-forming)